MKKTAMTLACLFLVLLLLPLFGSPAKAYDSGYWTYDRSWIGGAHAIITAYNGSDSDVTIPGSLDGFTVTHINDHAFDSNSYITNVVIPSSVTSIGQSAFAYCANLETVQGMENVKYFGKFAFQGCTSLEEFVIPDGVSKIEENTFCLCRNLSEVTIPIGVTAIGTDAFQGCSALEIIHYGGAYEQWVDVLANTGIRNDPLKLATIIYSATPITATGVCGAAGDNLTWTLEKDAFYLLRISGTGDMADYSGDTAPWNFDEKAHSIGYVTIYSGVTGIGANAFNGLVSMSSVTIPSTVKRIGEYAFCTCTSLQSIMIPSGVTSIAEGTFRNCFSLTNVTIPSTVASIADYAFLYCVGLNSITVPSSVKSIGEGAFRECSGLQSIVIPNGVTTIKKSTFEYCSNMTDVTIPGSVTSIDEYAFDNCNALTDVWFGGTQAQWATLLTHTGESNEALRKDSLIVHFAPSISGQPQNTSAAIGGSAKFVVTATGEGPFIYQWQYQKPGESTWNDVQINGTSATFNQTNVAARHNGYKFRCKVSNKAGTTISNAATLTVADGPTITTQPSSVTAALGSTATFKVVASGSGLTYKWQYQKPG
ncbi:MAG: leucine-rich repeat protein, partial [Kiritimatiellae bacterium]|nr:leucine-rich repeat protein [Kiritimatiellia bacterium]